MDNKIIGELRVNPAAGEKVKKQKFNFGLTRRQAITAAAIGATLPITSVRSSDKIMPSRRRLIVNALDTSSFNKNYLLHLKQGKIDCVNMDFSDYPAHYRFIHENSGDITLVRSVSEIVEAQKSGKIAAFFNSQEARAFETALYDGTGVLGSFKKMVAKVREHKSLGLGVQGLCYNSYNVFGSGCLNHDVPLSRAGERLVEAIHDNGIVLDIGGHTGERTSLDAIKISKQLPVVCSHTNFKTLNDNARAISDTLAAAIASSGGVVGITAISAFHTRNAKNTGLPQRQATLDEHLDHYDYAKRTIGIDHVGIGPDFILGAADAFEMDPDDSAAFPTFVMGPGKQTTVKGFEDISKLDNVIHGLRGRGWSELELDKLLGLNWLRVYDKIWGS